MIRAHADHFEGQGNVGQETHDDTGVLESTCEGIPNTVWYSTTRGIGLNTQDEATKTNALFSFADLPQALRTTGGRTLVLIAIVAVTLVAVSRSGLFLVWSGRIERDDTDAVLINKSRTKRIAFTVRKHLIPLPSRDRVTSTQVHTLSPGAQKDLGPTKIHHLHNPYAEVVALVEYKIVGAETVPRE